MEGSEQSIDPLRQEQERSPYSLLLVTLRFKVRRNHRVLSRMRHGGREKKGNRRREGGRQRVIEEGREGEEG